MTLWLVVWFCFQSLAPFWSKPMPQPMREAIFGKKVTHGWVVTSYRKEAEAAARKAKDEGGEAVMLELRGSRASEKQIRSIWEIEK